MTAYRSEIWLANLNPAKRANEIGKTRPVLIFQNDELNKSDYATPLRYRIDKRDKLDKNSDLLIAHIRSIDNNRLIQKIATLSSNEMDKIKKLLDEVLLNF